MRTLIIEDTLINQEFLRMIMEERGECVVVESGEEGLEAVSRALKESTPFDIIFMDVILPGMDGFKALEQIRIMEIEQGITPGNEARAIITTALDDSSNAQRASPYGQATSYIAKPIRQERIEDELRNLGFID
jgi:two-component system chemotaxis response regulator CheY